MGWKLIIEEFGTNIQHIYVVYNMVTGTLRKFSSTSVDKYEPITRKSLCCANELFTVGWDENNKDLPAKSQIFKENNKGS